jgi:hypothetical protein
MDLAEGISLAYRGEWKPFSTVHQSGRPKSAGALLGKSLALKSVFSRGTETKFEAKISGNQVVYPKVSEQGTSFPSPGRQSLVESRNLSTINDFTKASHANLSNVFSSYNSESSPALKKSFIRKQKSDVRLHSINAATTDVAINEAKAQKYKTQNMSTLIYHSVQHGCAFVPRASTSRKPTSQIPSSFATETNNNADSKTACTIEDKDAIATSGVLASSKKRSNQEPSKPCDPTSELVTSICEIRYFLKIIPIVYIMAFLKVSCRANLRTDDQISILMKQIQTIAFLSKLPQETLRELCRVMKVQSYYRKDRGMYHILESSDVQILIPMRCFSPSFYSRRRW